MGIPRSRAARIARHWPVPLSSKDDVEPGGTDQGRDSIGSGSRSASLRLPGAVTARPANPSRPRGGERRDATEPAWPITDFVSLALRPASRRRPGPSTRTGAVSPYSLLSSGFAARPYRCRWLDATARKVCAAEGGEARVVPD